MGINMPCIKVQHMCGLRGFMILKFAAHLMLAVGQEIGICKNGRQIVSNDYDEWKLHKERLSSLKVPDMLG